jgi:poly(hydroxyalkanoate) depolymerase family esterase
MAGLRATTARLAEYQRQWQKLRSASVAPSPSEPTRLTEVAAFGANSGNLRMLTCLPDGLPERAPLVVVLHGCTQDAGGYDVGAGWSALADRFGFALLMPEQRKANNPNACFNWFLPDDTTRGRGEAASIRQMIEHMLVDHALDRSRVFVTGLSAGGAMTSVMLATYPEIFAGGAIIAGLPYGAANNVQEALSAMFQGGSRPAAELGDLVRRASPHRGPWPRIAVWHGSVDPTVRPINAGEIEKQWLDVHGLSAGSAASDLVDGYPRQTWRDAAGQAMVESYTITGMAHGTPIAAGQAEQNCGAPAPFILEAGISSSYRILQFWGLTDGLAPRQRPSRPAAPKARPDAAGTVAGPARPGPQAVIDKALRAAGLLRR